MKEFDVTITETLKKTVTVEANSREEAERLVSDRWHHSDYILDAEDFAGVDFSCGRCRPHRRHFEKEQER
ncbi:MAG: DpnD/PcfM family protein [Oscillospiraceae bacterium]